MLISGVMNPGDIDPESRAPAAHAPLSAELTPVEALVHHAYSIPGDLPLEQTERTFRERNTEYLALTRNDRVTGLCSRRKLGELMASRFGFALHGREPAHSAQVDRPLVFEQGSPVRGLLSAAMARQGDAFHEDVVIVDAEHRLVGLVPAERLAHLQSRIMAEQFRQLEGRNLELRRTNEALGQAQALWIGLFESSLLGVALLDSDGRIQAYNRRFALLLGLPSGEAAGAHLRDFLPEADRDRWPSVIPAGPGSPPVKSELPLRVADRGTRLFRIAADWITATGHACLCIDDITDQRALERRMKQNEKQVLLDTLVGGIAHELNNKLTPVMGFAELLAGCADERTRNSYVGLVSKYTAEAAGIIRQLLHLSRPETGQRLRVDLREVVRDTLIMLKFQLRESRTQLHTELPNEAVEVSADPAQLKQVLINLVINALHATEHRSDGQIVIRLRREEAAAELEVRDNGSGMPPEVQQRIFDPFFTTKAPDRGTGLGLSVCQSILRQHAGSIAVESEPGRGARFLVSLPVAAGSANAAAVPAPVPVRAAPGERTGAGRVLVVDDEDSIRLLLGQVLGHRLGCRVDFASNGAAALESARASRYDLVVSDVRMPGMSGTELYSQLLDSDPALARRFVFVTGHAGDSELSHTLAAWDVPVLRKPFSPAEVTAVCGPLLGGGNLAA
ncbi:sporulation kinase E [mine drainage metagenome]|uniref:histidine kinase n=1 Tax=mine drainage metagenome TaxID=410659 RepID=A0A1J5SA79_9ZZZZ